MAKRCVSGKQAGRDVAYLWDGDAMVEAVTTACGEVVETVRYFYEPGSLRPMAQEVNGAVQLIMCDHLGTPTELFSEAGELLWSRKGRLWGADYGVARLKAANDNGAYVDCLIRFQGQFFDAETGLHYNRHRYYDPYSGEYLSPDPIGLAGGLRSYGYVTDPTAWIDPLGLAGCNRSFDSRKQAFNQAKRDAGIPTSAQPIVTKKVPLTDRNEKVILGDDFKPIETNEYHFINNKGDRVVIQDHKMGHKGFNPGDASYDPHFNVREYNPKTGNAFRNRTYQGTYDHYNFP